MANLEELLALQEQAMNTIHRILPNFKKLGKAKWTTAVVQNRHFQLKDTFSKCEGLDAKINMLATDAHRASLNYFVANQFVKCEDYFNEASDFMAEVLSTLDAFRSAASTYSSQNVAAKPVIPLPQIKLPSFDGRLTEWEAYRDQFKSLIHCSDALSACEKMHYLKSSLSGDALRTISHLAITSPNYDIAWRILISRYENKRRLINQHVTALLNLSRQTAESVTGLQNLRDTLNSSLQSLRSLDRPVDAWPDVIIIMITSKFDAKTRRAWETRLGDAHTLPTYQDLDQFLASRIQVLEAVNEHGAGDSSNRSTSYKRPGRLVSHYASTQDAKPGSIKGGRKATFKPNPSIQCSSCHENHWITRCPQFLTLPVAERLTLVEKKRLCRNCLSSSHFVNDCGSIHRCRICAQRHHTLLHSATTDDASLNRARQSTAIEETGTVSSNSAAPVHPVPAPVLLATARVRISTSNGRWATVRALLDQGSAATLMTEGLAHSLRVDRRKCSLRIAGINGRETNAKHTATVTITPTGVKSPAYPVNAIILSSLTQYTPERIKCSASWEHTSHLQLADPDPFSAEPIELIIGADLYGIVLRDGKISGNPNQPTAQNTIFGWILSGLVSADNSHTTLPSLNVNVFERLNEQLRQFWETEELPSIPSLTSTEQECEDHFRATHSRNAQGRYVVRLPFKSHTRPKFGNSRTAALLNLLRLERQLGKDTRKQFAYTEFMREYEALGHMTRCPDAADDQAATYYIPHHAVMRSHSKTSQLRVVFNASAETTDGRSLNDCLASGPKLQLDLAAIILRWRQCEFALTADIAKMYRQILIHSDDANYQRILWRPSATEAVIAFQLQTVTYGTTSALFLALRVIQQLINDDGRYSPLASAVLRHQTYVDDCIFGAASKELAMETRDQLVSLLHQGGFRLRKWASNCPDLLQAIDPIDHGLAIDKELNPDESLHILGICWQPERDVLHFRLSLPPIPGNTKRQLLSAISQFYDPLGWLTPVTLTAKTFIQQLWALKCDWDHPIPDSMQSDWNKYYTELTSLTAISIPRWTRFSPQLTSYELHGFADASMTAYAAAVYMRCVSPDQQPRIALLIAKSRVAPLKIISVPRLELCAAQLLARLLGFVATSFADKPTATYCWTDSTIVLAWLQQSPNRWTTFVANRVSIIQTLTSAASWRHVPTQDNPADCASRGVFPSGILHHSLWWNGPGWLLRGESEWPQHCTALKNDDLPEERVIHSHHVCPPIPAWDLRNRFSSWPKLLRVTALILSFIRRLRHPTGFDDPNHVDGTNPVGRFHLRDFQRAKRYWLRVVQQDSFSSELRLLENNGQLPPGSPLADLAPFIDSEGLLRVGGRLRHAEIKESIKHPILLKSHPLVDLIIRHNHIITLHGGLRLTFVTLRQEFWLLRARSVIRTILSRCRECVREKAVIPTELMGDLPHVRVNRSARAFAHTGVDYAGPIAVRTAPGRGHRSHKAYIALFVCMTVKALHLELVSDCSTAAFLAAYHRFTARRGLPTTMYSDNGTTFRGADRDIRSAFVAAIRDSTFQGQLMTAEVQWHFLPPSAPHFGGLWEAGVKSVKHHLRRCVGSQTLTFEEMTTLLCKIEACLNSRPIAQMSESLSDYMPLTPGHFLIGTSMVAQPELSVLHLNENRLSRWQLLHQMTEGFWKAWSSDYLHSLQQRPKWRVVQQLATVGRLVLLRNPNAPPSRWELGRITACHPGPDGLIRVVSVKTSTSEYTRPLVKLCFLPVHIHEEESSAAITAGGQPDASALDVARSTSI